MNISFFLKIRFWFIEMLGREAEVIKEEQRKTHYNDLLEFSVYSEIKLSFKEQTFENADILRSLETLFL